MGPQGARHVRPTAARCSRTSCPIDLVANQLDSTASKLALTLPAAGARGARGAGAQTAAPAGGRGGRARRAPVTRVFEMGKDWTAGAGGFGGRGAACLRLTSRRRRSSSSATAT